MYLHGRYKNSDNYLEDDLKWKNADIQTPNYLEKILVLYKNDTNDKVKIALATYYSATEWVLHGLEVGITLPKHSKIMHWCKIPKTPKE